MTWTWLDPGGSATGGTEFLQNITGAVTAQTSNTNGQAYSYKFDTGATPSNAQAFRNGVIGVARRISFYVTIPAAPTGDINIELGAAAGTVHQLSVMITSARTVRLYSNGTSIPLGAAGSTVIPTNTPTRITLSYSVTTTTNWSAKVYINGALELTRTNADGTLGSATLQNFGVTVRLAAGTNYAVYLSDLAIDDTADQSDPGDIHVTAKLPTTTTTNDFNSTVGTGGVNERPVSTANGRSHTATTDVDQDYEIQAAAAGDVDISGATVVESMGWIWATLGSLTGTPSTNIIVNGARIAATWDPSSANVAQLFTTIIGSGATYPANANGKNIGSSSSVIAADTFLYDCGVVIAYIPSSGPQNYTRDVAGNEPAATGTLTRIKQALRSLAGSQPNATGTLTYLRGYIRSLAGDQPAATGSLARIKQALRSLTGDQPAPAGTLARLLQALRALAGSQPNATGALTRVYQALRALSGNQPAASGALSYIRGYVRSVTGSQDTASGTLTAQKIVSRDVAGDQPAATGTLAAHLIEGYEAVIRGTAGLIAYWRLGESSGTAAPDALGGHDGSYVGSPALGARGLIFADPNTSVTLDGIDDQITIPDHADLSPQVGPTGAISVEFWVQMPPIGVGVGNIIGKQGDFIPPEWFCYIDPSGGGISWSGGAPGPGTGATNDLSLGAIHHVFGVYDGATRISQVYVDGIAGIAGAAGTGEAVVNGADVVIGNYDGGSEFSSFTIDEVAIYDVALDEATIRAHFLAGTGLVTGDQPAATGTLSRILQALRSLSGDQPSATGTLARIYQALRSLAGNQPNATGSLARVLEALRSLSGDQPSAAGALTALKITARSITGNQPAATGALSRIKQALRSLTGDQPAATGTLSRLAQVSRALTGNQPAATGELSRHIDVSRSLDGDQPAPSGELTRIYATTVLLAGDQPSATGTLVAFKGIPNAVGSVGLGSSGLAGAGVGSSPLDALAVGKTALGGIGVGSSATESTVEIGSGATGDVGIGVQRS